MARKAKDFRGQYKNDASCISNKRGMAKRAKTKSNKSDRQFLKKDLDEQTREKT